MKRFVVTTEEGDTFTILSSGSKQDVIKSVWNRMQTEVTIIKVYEGEDEAN
jgi:hypothetical protein